MATSQSKVEAYFGHGSQALVNAGPDMSTYQLDNRHFVAPWWLLI